MVIQNKIFESIDSSVIESHETFHLINCIIGTIDLVGVFELNVNLKIENCLIDNLQIHSCWFLNGFLLKNSIVKNFVDYQMGGHNEHPVIIEGNIFIEFFNFFDCHFEDVIELKNNIFRKGTNLIGNKGEGFENSFAAGWSIDNNIGRTDLDIITPPSSN